jgi:hypothetical protein
LSNYGVLNYAFMGNRPSNGQNHYFCCPDE